MSDTPNNKRSISVQSDLSSTLANDENELKRARVDSNLSFNGVPDINSDIDLSLPNVDSSQLSLPDISLPDVSLTPQPLSSQTPTPSQNNLNTTLQLPDFVPSSTSTSQQQQQQQQQNTQVEATKDDLQKGPAPADPDKLADALLSSGVDLKAEEQLLTQNSLQPPGLLLNGGLQQQQLNLNQKLVHLDPFLDQRNLITFVNGIIGANKLKSLSSSIEEEKQILDLITAACEEWMKGILTTTVITSRHRRRSSRRTNKKRSEISKALRELALKDKAQEDNRIERNKKLGLSNDDIIKEGTEEIQHKATNATVAMMTAGRKKKKYSWMTGGTGGAGAGSGSKSSGSGAGANEQTIRFREAREEPGIAVRDLLSSLEKKRMGVDKTLVKGYAKLKD